MNIVYQDLYEYHCNRGFSARCQLFVGQSDIHDFVVAKELDDNPGASITNIADALMDEVCESFDLSKNRLRWFEWYDHHSDNRLKFTEYLFRNGCWRPSHEGDTAIILQLIRQSARDQ